MVQIDNVIRSNRKSIAIIVERDGRLVVRCPKRASMREIKRLVRENESWIRARQREVRERYPEMQPKRYIDGEQFYFLGETYTLVLVDRVRPALLLNHRFELSKSARPNAEGVFVEWYRERSRQVIGERVEMMAAKHGFTYQGIRITSARARWGSCNSRGGLNFTWRLVMAPLYVIDYVVLHELLHTKIKNHSREFWGRMETLMPDYRQRVAWLKGNGYKFTLS